ncbi:hypothetical protein [Flavobacterium aquariorum]|nr:hypothetical protein [Flavobacterium aquariorum]
MFFDKTTLKNRLKSMEFIYLRLNAILDKLEIDLKDRTVFEFGSGWFPTMPYFFKYKFKARKVEAFDVNQHFKRKTVLEFNTIFSKKDNCNIEDGAKNKYGLPNYIEYFPNFDLVLQDIPIADIVFSRFVLFHMKEIDVIGFCDKIINQYNKGTYVIHFISPSDLVQHNDNTISQQEFLKYSKLEW